MIAKAIRVLKVAAIWAPLALVEALFVLAFGLITHGVWRIFAPAGWIAAGVFVLIVAVAASRRSA